MLRHGRETGSDTTALQKASATMPSDATTTMPEMSSVSEYVNVAVATVAYHLWIERGCPIGSDQEDWFRAEAMLKNALLAECADLFMRPPISSCATRIEFGRLAEFPCEEWQGHWEVWEREWGGARWVWDVHRSGVGASTRTRSSGAAG